MAKEPQIYECLLSSSQLSTLLCDISFIWVVKYISSSWATNYTQSAELEVIVVCALSASRTGVGRCELAIGKTWC